MAIDTAFAPDLLLVNGRILTMTAPSAEVQALAIKGGAIAAVGTTKEIAPLAGAGTRVIDLDGRFALPGLTDCHVHLASDANETGEVVECRDLHDPRVSSVAEIVSRIREAAQSSPPGQFIVGRASPLQYFRLKERRLPAKAELDSAAPRNPVYINFGPHVTMANSECLRVRDITADTPDPQGGRIVKDEQGQPTGELRERAKYLVTVKESKMPVEDLAEHIHLSLEKCLRRGVTGVHDIVVDKKELQAYQLLARQNRLDVRVQMLIRVIESQFRKDSLLDLGLVQGFGSDWLRVGGIKMSIDGGFTGRNAAFSEPLDDDHENVHCGLVRIDQGELDETVEMYHNAGMRICIHAIGDVALDMVLDAYAKAQAKNPRTDHRHRVEHMGNWMMSPERTARATALGLLPVPNPPFLYFFGDPLVDMIGRRVTDKGFPFRDLWDAGFPLTFGSDSPGYYAVDPLRDLGTAVAHQTLSDAKVSADEALTRWEAFRTQTVNAAFAGFREHELGTLEPGKLADVAVLGDDPFTYPPEQFGRLPIDLTISGGKVVHESSSRSSQ